MPRTKVTAGMREVKSSLLKDEIIVELQQASRITVMFDRFDAQEKILQKIKDNRDLLLAKDLHAIRFEAASKGDRLSGFDEEFREYLKEIGAADEVDDGLDDDGADVLSEEEEGERPKRRKVRRRRRSRLASAEIKQSKVIMALDKVRYGTKRHDGILERYDDATYQVGVERERARRRKLAKEVAADRERERRERKSQDLEKKKAELEKELSFERRIKEIGETGRAALEEAKKFIGTAAHVRGSDTVSYLSKPLKDIFNHTYALLLGFYDDREDPLKEASVALKVLQGDLSEQCYESLEGFFNDLLAGFEEKLKKTGKQNKIDQFRLEQYIKAITIFRNNEHLPAIDAKFLKVETDGRGSLRADEDGGAGGGLPEQVTRGPI